MILNKDGIPAFVQNVGYHHGVMMFYVLFYDKSVRAFPHEYFAGVNLSLTRKPRDTELDKALAIVADSLNRIGDAKGWEGIEAFERLGSQSNAERLFRVFHRPANV